MQEEKTIIHRTRDAAALQAAFTHEGCPVCIVVLEAMQRSMDSWQYEGFSDVQHRHELILSRGFCPLHTWQLAQQPTAFQLALVYREVLTEVLNGLELDSSRHTLPGTTSHGES